MRQNNVDELGSLYLNVLKAMKKIAIGIPNAVSGLVNIAKQWYATIEFLHNCMYYHCHYECTSAVLCKLLFAQI